MSRATKLRIAPSSVLLRCSEDSSPVGLPGLPLPTPLRGSQGLHRILGCFRRGCSEPVFSARSQGVLALPCSPPPPRGQSSPSSLLGHCLPLPKVGPPPPGAFLLWTPDLSTPRIASPLLLLKALLPESVLQIFGGALCM